MTLIERLKHLASAWSDATGRSTATLSSRVVRDGKTFDRIAGGGSCTVDTAERFFAFFREGGNWPDGAVPAVVGETLDGVDLAIARLAENHDDRNAA